MRNRLFVGIVVLSAMMLTGCYQDEIDRLDKDLAAITDRVEALELWKNETNSNIAAIQTILTALEAKDYVTSVTPLADGTGYVITFSQSGTVTIYHGQNGADGYTPDVSVKKDTDGVYYWTLDGEWLTDADGNKIPTTGPKGDKGETGEKGDKGDTGDKGDKGDTGATGDKGDKGDQGEAGEKGEKGEDGITPELKIEDGYWYVSVDNGTTWTKLGKATGEDGADGANGRPGSSGDSIFMRNGVSVKDDYIEFTLADGKTKFQVPRSSNQVISFDSTTDVFKLESGTPGTIDLKLETGDFVAIKAEIVPVDGKSVVTKSGEEWSAELTKDSATGVYSVEVTQPSTITQENVNALLTITLIGSNGVNHSISKVVEAYVDYIKTTEGTTDTYTVYTAKGLQAVNYLVTGVSITGVTPTDIITSPAQENLSANITLAADITLPHVSTGASNWTPIGYISDESVVYGYTGIFDGAGYSIKNLTINATDKENQGLIGVLGETNVRGEVKNVNLTDCNIQSTKMFVGGIVGRSYANSTISGCSIRGTSVITTIGGGNFSRLGGIVGLAFGQVVDCIVSGNITIGDETSQTYVGGIAGEAFSNVSNCKLAVTDNGNIYIKCSKEQSKGGYVGGIAGAAYGAVDNCHVVNSGSGTIIIDGGHNSVGGVVGITPKGTGLTGGSDVVTYEPKVLNSSICNSGTGKIEIKAEMYNVGGFVGNSGPGATFIKNCSAIGCTIISENSANVGGFIGYGGVESVITGCVSENNSVISKIGGIGGFVGVNDATIIACYASKNRVAVTENANNTLGGFVGRNDESKKGGSKILSCYAYQCYTDSPDNKTPLSGVTNFIGSSSVDNSSFGSISECHFYALGTAAGVTTVIPVNGVSVEAVAGSAKDWDEAVDAMNAAIETWNTANDPDCNYRWATDKTYATAELVEVTNP